jgi:hypothetical protein
MKIHRLLPLLAALPGLTGCPTEPCFSGGVGSTAMPPGMILVGEETRLQLSPNLQFGCEGTEAATPTSLTVEVYDADNQPVEHQSSLSATSTGAATIRFTARKPGRHHVFVAFDPVGGIQQLDLYAALDRSKDSSAYSLSRPCATLEHTQQGALVCNQEVLRNGVPEKSFPDSRVAVVGNVVWVVSGSKFERYEDSGTALVLTASLPHTLGATEAVLASENEVVVLHASVMQRIVFNGTALASTGTTPWVAPLGPISSTGPRVLLLRAGDRLGLVSRNTTTSNGIPLHQVCPYRLESGRFIRVGDACPTFNGLVVGYEHGALWMGDPVSFSESNFNSLRYVEWTATGLVDQAALPLGFSLRVGTNAFSGRLSAVPAITSAISSFNSRPRVAVPVYSAERRAILLEYLDPDFVEPLATSQLVWGPPNGASTNLGIRIRVRPPSGP